MEGAERVHNKRKRDIGHLANLGKQSSRCEICAPSPGFFFSACSFREIAHKFSPPPEIRPVLNKVTRVSTHAGTCVPPRSHDAQNSTLGMTRHVADPGPSYSVPSSLIHSASRSTSGAWHGRLAPPPARPPFAALLCDRTSEN